MTQGRLESDCKPAAESRVYLDQVIPCVPRLLSELDREPLSTTYGCFDRTYWAWKFTDFPASRFQEGVYTLALLREIAYRGGDCKYGTFHNLVEWCRAGYEFWRGTQHRDGSFDEAYPHERSLAATAFTAFYLGEAYSLISADLPASDRESIRQTIARAAGWLTRHGERHAVISNHLGAAAAALHVAVTITGEGRFELARDKYLRSIYEHQSAEGWYREYGGADPGYQTLTLYFLASIWRSRPDPQLTESLRSGVHFLKHFVHPDGTLGGEYGSRGTEIYFPAGFEILAGAMPDAASVAAAMRMSIERGATAGPRTMDAQNFRPLLNNYLDAARHAGAIGNAGPLPCDLVGEWVFEDAGLFVKSTRSYFAVFGQGKGGVLKVFGKTNRLPLHSHCGYWLRLERGGIASTQHTDGRSWWRHSPGDVEVESSFRLVPQKVFSPVIFVAFRLASLLWAFVPGPAYWIKTLLVKQLTRPGRRLPLRVRRRVAFREESVTVSDQIKVERRTGLRITTLRGGEKFSTFHTGSARYFQPGEFELPPLEKDDWAKILMEQGEVTIEREVGVGERPSHVGGAS